MQALRLTPEQARSAWIGVCRKGVLASRVAIPMRIEDGSIHYMGFNPKLDPPLKLPKL